MACPVAVAESSPFTGASASVAMPPGDGARLVTAVAPLEASVDATSVCEDQDVESELGGEYRCNLCEKTFAVPARLTRHYRIHTGERPFRCEECGKCFSVKENLSVHRRTHTKERPYKCEYCDRAFEHSGKLHRHLRIHTGERPHRCSDCGKTFIQSGQLVIHLRTHTGEKPYVCTVCNKGFTCSKQLKVHHRTHTGEKPYVCPICGKAFGYNHVLKLHQMQHFGEKLYKCVLCFETLSSKKALETHLRQHKDSSSSSSPSHSTKSPPASTSRSRVIPSPTDSADTSTSDSAQSSLSGQDEVEIVDFKKRPGPKPQTPPTKPQVTSSSLAFGSNPSLFNFRDPVSLPNPELRFPFPLPQHPSQSYPWLTRPLPRLLPLSPTPQMIQRPMDEELLSWSRLLSLQQYASHLAQASNFPMGVTTPAARPELPTGTTVPPRKRFRPMTGDDTLPTTATSPSSYADQRLLHEKGGGSATRDEVVPSQQVNGHRLQPVVDIDLDSVRLRSVIQFAHRVTAQPSQDTLPTRMTPMPSSPPPLPAGTHVELNTSVTPSPQLRSYVSPPDSHPASLRATSYLHEHPPSESL